jgi:hypothetical protein
MYRRSTGYLHGSIGAAMLAFWLIAPATAQAEFVRAGREHAGVAVTCDLPNSEHLLNAVGTDGAGLCVFTSIEHCARWQNELALLGLRDYMRQHPGGGWPARVAAVIPAAAKARGLQPPGYLQHTGGDVAFLRGALASGRYVAVTYDGRDGVFYRGRIYHMVNLVHLCDRWAVIHDNNFPTEYLWMSPAEFLSRWQGSGGGWAVVLLRPGPPPIPVNRDSDSHRRAAPPRRGEPMLAPSGPTPTWPITANAKLALLRVCLLPGGTTSTPTPEEPVQNFGLDPKQLPDAASYERNGQPITREEALATLSVALPDERGKLRLTVVGEEDWRRQIVQDIERAEALAWVRGRVVLQDYPSEHWAVQGVGLVPGITLQAPADARGRGVVLLRLTRYEGPTHLAAAIRKADPDYRPDRDPTGQDGQLRIPWAWLEQVPPLVWVILAVAWWLSRRRAPANTTPPGKGSA